jgi:intron-binding protein aquarius
MNLVVRRKPEESNFKAVLETIRDLMNSPNVISGKALPFWFHDIFLGYGNPSSAHYRSLHNITH